MIASQVHYTYCIYQDSDLYINAYFEDSEFGAQNGKAGAINNK